jgi:hypothetical protein
VEKAQLEKRCSSCHLRILFLTLFLDLKNIKIYRFFLFYVSLIPFNLTMNYKHVYLSNFVQFQNDILEINATQVTDNLKQKKLGDVTAEVKM